MSISNEIVQEASKWLKLLDAPDEFTRRLATSKVDELSLPKVVGLMTHEQYKKQEERIRASGVAASHRDAAQFGGPNARAFAIKWLGLLRDPADSDLIIAALSHDDPRVRCAAAGALWKWPIKSVIEPLTRATFDSDEATAMKAMLSLGSIGDPAALPCLLDWQKNRSWKRRMYAYWALGDIDDSLAVAAVRDGLRDAKPQVRKAAKSALGSFDLRRRRCQDTEEVH